MALSQLPLPLVLRLPRQERKADPPFVLLHVSSDGDDLLDLRLVGTDSSEVFAYTLKHNRTPKLRSKNSNICQEDWESILASVLLGKVPGQQADFQGVEAITQVVGEKSMTITVQKKIEGITQLFGEIVLKYDEDEPIDLFEWTCLSIKSKDKIESEIAASGTIAKEKDDQIRKLEETLSEFTALKKQNEDHLFEKFSLLLNEKKLKVRQQQRVIASANIDTSKLEPEDIDVDRELSAGPSRPRKRKDVVEEDSDEDVKMQIDEPEAVEPDSDEADRNTASETESDSDTDTMPSQPKVSSKPKPISPPRRKTRAASAQPEKTNDDLDEDGMPPRRALPFQKKPVENAKKVTPLPPPTENSETESETDEL